MAINKVEYGGNTLIDITDTTATSNDVLNGEVFYNADGTRGVGSLTMGNSKTYYGTSSTGASTSAKTADITGYTLEEGNTIFIKFTNANSYNGTATLNINSTGAKNITRVGTTTTTRYWWTAGEVVGFIYDGTNYVMIDKGSATTTYYGLTKLTNSVTSTSTSTSATPNSVKLAYDLADSKQDEITNENKLDYSLIANTPTIPTVPTTVSSFTNDAGYITSSDIPTNISYFTNDELYVSENDLSTVATTGDYDDLTNKPTIPSLNGLIYTEIVTIASNITVNANTNTSTATYTLSPRSGYTAVMATLDNVYNGAINLWYCTLADNKIAWRVRNVSGTNATGVTVKVCVLYIKTGCIAT